MKTHSFNRNIKISLLFIATMGVMSGITIVSSLPLISKTFNNIENIEFLSKLMLTIPSIIIALFAPIAGILVDKFGRLKSLYSGIILFVLGGSSGLYLDNFYYILIGRAALGVAVALIMTSSTALIADYFNEEERHSFMSVQGVSVALGGILFITLGGLLAQMHWSYPFAIYLSPIIFLPLIIYSLYEPVKHHHIVTATENSDSLWLVYMTAFFSMVLFYMLPTQLPYLIINTFQGDPSSVGFVIATALLFNALASKQYAKLKKRFSYIQIYSITFAFFGVGLFIISQAKIIPHLFFSTLFLGVGFGLLLVNTNSWFLSKVPPHKRGKASGILASSLFLGQFSSPLLFKPIVKIYGIQKLFFMIAFVALTISLVLFIKIHSIKNNK